MRATQPFARRICAGNARQRRINQITKALRAPPGIAGVKDLRQLFRGQFRAVSQGVAMACREQRQIAAIRGCPQPGAQRIYSLRLQRAHQRGKTHIQRRRCRGIQRRQRFTGQAVVIQRIKLRQHARQRATVAQNCKHRRRCFFHQTLRQFLPHPLGHQRVGFAVLHHLHHQRLRFRRDGEIKARGKPRNAQDAHRIFGKRRTDVTQHAFAKVVRAVIRVDQPAAVGTGHRIDGQVAALQILFQRDVGCGVKVKAVITGRGLALGARQRIFLMGLRMQEHRKIAADRAEALLHHLFGCGADDDVIPVLHRQAEHLVTHRTADNVDFHERPQRPARLRMLS